MSGIIQGVDRQQETLFPEALDDYITEDNSVRVVDVFIESLNLAGLGFTTTAGRTGRPGYHPAVLLKLYVYGYVSTHPRDRVRFGGPAPREVAVQNQRCDRLISFCHLQLHQ